jgi:5-methylcytosine-specific restriction endonuclease McrA
VGLPADYDLYLKTAYWQTLRDRKLEQVGYRCGRCGIFARRGLNGRWMLLQIHHKTYERMPFRERDEDLEVLCGACHAAHHGHESGATFEQQLLRFSRRTAGLTAPAWEPEDIDVEIAAWDNLAREAGC